MEHPMKASTYLPTYGAGTVEREGVTWTVARLSTGLETKLTLLTTPVDVPVSDPTKSYPNDVCTVPGLRYAVLIQPPAGGGRAERLIRMDLDTSPYQAWKGFLRRIERQEQAERTHIHVWTWDSLGIIQQCRECGEIQ